VEAVREMDLMIIDGA
jgi:hypothetical protein